MLKLQMVIRLVINIIDEAVVVWYLVEFCSS